VNEQAYKTVDKFDKVMGTLTSLPDVTHTKPSTVVSTTPLIGATQTFIIQTFRQIDRDGDDSKSRDTLFMQYVDDTGSQRIVIPHGVIDAIVRQRDSLTTKVRKKIGKANAAARKARGELPGFMKPKIANTRAGA
jgi:hypothetical protein